MGDLSGKNPLLIDLFCAETANLLAEQLQVFGTEIPEKLSSQIRQRLQTQIFENYLQAQEYGWLYGESNWNAVCHQGVVGAALGLVEDVDLLTKILLKMSKHLPKYIDGFTDDGGCTEGPGYWNYGFGWFCALNWQLETRTKGQLSILEGDSKLREVARFWLKVSLSNGNLANFADCPVNTAPLHWLIQYLAEQFQDSDLERFSHQAYHDLLKKDGYRGDGKRDDFFARARTFLKCPDLSKKLEPMPLRDDVLPKLGVIVSRARIAGGTLVELAAKGGHNAEIHNHNDVGSFLFNVDGERMLVEIGSPEYVQATFGRDRYTFTAMRSLGHSVPFVNGFEQGTGWDFQAKILQQSFTPDRAEFVLDITRAYPAEAGCSKLIRTLLLDKKTGRLTVSDEIELEKLTGVTDTAIVSDEAPCLEGNVATIRRGRSAIKIIPQKGSAILGVKPYAYRSHGGEDTCIYRLSIGMEKPAGQGKIGYEVVQA